MNEEEIKTRGFVPRYDCNHAPADWSGGEVLWRNGRVTTWDSPSAGWKQFNLNSDFIGYRTKPTASEHPEYSPELVGRGACDIASERARQIEAEGWSPEHDDQYTNHELVYAALCFLLAGRDQESCLYPPEPDWPWDISWWKPENPRRALVKAGALIASEIDRLDRSILSELDKSKEVDPDLELAREVCQERSVSTDFASDEEDDCFTMKAVLAAIKRVRAEQAA